MYTNLLSFIAIGFIILLSFNLYLRLSVFKYYRILSKQNVDFSMSQLLSKKRITEEVLPRYPKYKDEISKLSRNVRISIRLASVILVGIIVLGIVIMRNS